MKHSRILVILALAAAVMFTATAAFAQDNSTPGPDHRQGPGRGFGGPRGGMLPPEIQSTLSADQKTQIENIRKDEHAQMQALGKESLTQDQFRQRAMAIRQDGMQKVQSVLTPDQKAKLDALHKEHGGPRPDGRRQPPPQKNS